MNATATPEKVAAASKANLETLAALTRNALDRTERLAKLNLATARAALEDGTANAKAMMGAKDVQELMKLQAGLAKPMVEKAVAYARSVYQIAAAGQEEVASAVEAQVADLSKSLNAALDEASKAAPAGSEAVFAAVKSGVAVASDAYDSVAKAARQVSEAAEANLTAATEATVEAVGKAAKTAAAKKEKEED
jgi:phasin family protein